MRCLSRLHRMERLWSLAVATGGNRWQTGQPRERLKEAKRVAAGCDGKEGVDGSSPSEGFSFLPALVIAFVFSADADRIFRRPPSVHQRPRIELGRVERVEELDGVLASVPSEVAVVTVDHCQAGAHVAGEVEG